MPLLLAARLTGRRLPERVAGSDLVPALFDRYRDHSLRVYLLGAAEGVADRAARCIAEHWSGVEVVGTCSPPYGFEHDPMENATILAQVAASSPDVLLVGLGAPKQEVWVHAHRDQIAAPVALCIGATIDFLAGNKPRAPRWMQRSGLEWLHRIATDPVRLLPRYVGDARVYPWLVFREVLRTRASLGIPAEGRPPSLP
jgi:N-acetylglucosaminyldiphosphoundecaprenol N-acetyl-beta-D-mannosaminyltransferase